MDAKKFWDKKHIEYAHKDWVDKPSIFARFAVKYFPKKGKLLDLGSGQGQDSRFFSKKGYSVTAVDLSNEALSILKRKAKSGNLNIKALNLDLSKKFPFKSKSFDIVYSHLALHYFDNKTTTRIFNEISRILKAKGILSALFNTVKDPEIKEFKKIEECYYKDPSGIFKRYFTTDSLKDFIKGKFEPLTLDAKGETYKDEIKTLIRFIGKKI